ncbi:MAG: mechanosensitive ion channel family protein [Lentisphaeria bacterium]|nr:mechanosensitive ion channel family protein [Lentisphaeria bacterium]
MDFSKLIEDEFTPEWAKSVIHDLSPYPYLADILVIASSFAVGALFSLILFFLLRPLLNRFYRRHCTMNAELQACISRMIISFVGCLPLVLISYSVWCDGIHEWVAVMIIKPLWGIGIALLALTGTYAIKSFGLWYKQQRNAEQRPIDGLIELAICFVWVAAIIVFIAMLIEKSPVYLLSGLGAIAAVLLLLFQHTIQSFVASVEINTDHLVEIGDWIVMETEDFEDIDGIVTDISLHTVKVRNWDRTQVCLPISFMVSKPFVNYTAMEKGGGRRIQKAFLIDQRTIRFLSAEEVEILKGFDLLKDYLEDRQNKISEYNSTRSGFNTRHLTNLGVFRIYAQRYLEQNPDIRADLTLFVRALSPSDSGVPLEIYCFTREVQWVPFERVQSKIMEHLLAVLPSFGLRVFQRSSDIHQEGRYQIDVVGGAFPSDSLNNPVRPGIGDSSGERNS